MRTEALQSPRVVAEQLAQDTATLSGLVGELRRRAPEHIVTIARGSSDHAAAYFGYLCMLRLGRYVTSLPPSLLSLYAAPLQRIGTLADAQRLMVVSRGPGMAVALEAALKFKETCGIQAETFSSAELRHGPMALIDQGYPLLILAPRGPAQEEMGQLADEMRARGARVLLAITGAGAKGNLPCTTAAHPDLDPVCLIQSFYLMVDSLARARGRDPDKPSYLSKVTLTT
ncbi:MAG: SIS domain-containing protein [Betaproteobacteria bacterium]|nr:SIS domain-containing protein [Betaproteobacteria bacterium]